MQYIHTFNNSKQKAKLYKNPSKTKINVNTYTYLHICTLYTHNNTTGEEADECLNSK